MNVNTTISALLSPGLCALTEPCRRHLPDAGSPGAPHSVWIAPPRAVKTPIAAGTELPIWAFEAACHEYAPHGGPAAVLHGLATVAEHDKVEPAELAPSWLRAAEEVTTPLAEVVPLALAVVLDDPAEHGTAEAHHDPDFYRGLYDALAPGAIALVHTHTAASPNGLLDPAAAILTAAGAAGFGYLQHVVIVHTRLDAPTSPRYRPPDQAPLPPACRRVHSDLYVLRKPEAAEEGGAR